MTLLCSFHCNARTEAIDVGSVLSGKLEYSRTLEQCRKVHNIQLVTLLLSVLQMPAVNQSLIRFE